VTVSSGEAFVAMSDPASGGDQSTNERRQAAGRLRSIVVDQLPWALAFVAAALVGRAAVEAGIALVWPASGVAATWLWLRWGDARWLALVLLAVAAFGVNLATGALAGVAVVFAATNVVLAATFAFAVHRACPGLVAGESGVAIEHPRPLVVVTLAALGAASAEALLAWAGLASQGVVLDPSGVLAYASADASAVLAGFVLVVLVRQRSRSRSHRRTGSTNAWIVFTLGTLAFYGSVFGQDHAPLAFVPFVWLMWLSSRGDVLLAIAQVVVGTATAVVLHLHGHGPFQLVPGLREQATLLQVFVACSLLVGLFVSAQRNALDRLTAQLRDAEATAAADAELLEAAFESMSDAVSVVAADGSVLRTNLGAREVAAMIGAQIRLGGAAMLDADGQPIPPERTPSRRALAGEAVETDVLLRDLDGALRTYRVHAIPLGRGDVDEPARALAVFHDVTRERAIVDDLEGFAATVAHDLRGPLTGMRGWADLAAQLASEQDRDAASEALLLDAVTRVQQGADRMDGLIGDLLVHVTSRGRALDLQEVDLAELMRGVVADRGLEAVVRVGSLPPVRGDAVLLRHLLDNLVGNAVAYARPGVPVHVSVTGERVPGEDQVLVRVSDNGRGVPVDLRERVFERFERVPGTGVEGTGLGLSICRTIAERHGGSISVGDGPDGQGSTFTVRLPAA
jgi:signal transduction histidine kinase